MKNIATIEEGSKVKGTWPKEKYKGRGGLERSTLQELSRGPLPAHFISLTELLLYSAQMKFWASVVRQDEVSDIILNFEIETLIGMKPVQSPAAQPF